MLGFNKGFKMDMFGDVHAMPAYGRDYKSKAAVMEDWNNNKDFICALTGRYLSKRSPFGLCQQVWIRYDKARKILRVH